MPRKSAASSPKQAMRVSKRLATRLSSKSGRHGGRLDSPRMASSLMNDVLARCEPIAKLRPLALLPALMSSYRPHAPTPIDCAFQVVDLPLNTIKLRIHGEGNHPTCQTLHIDRVNFVDEDEEDYDPSFEDQCEVCVYFLDDPNSRRLARWSSSNELDDVIHYSLGIETLSATTDVYLEVDVDVSPIVADNHSEATKLAHKALSRLITTLKPYLLGKRVWLDITQPDISVIGDDEYRLTQFRMFSNIRCESLIVRQIPTAWQTASARILAEVTSRSPALDLFSQRAEILRLPYNTHHTILPAALDSLFDHALRRDIVGFEQVHQNILATMQERHPQDLLYLQQGHHREQSTLNEEYQQTANTLRRLHEGTPNMSAELYQDSINHVKEEYQRRRSLLLQQHSNSSQQIIPGHEDHLRALVEECQGAIELLHRLYQSDPLVSVQLLNSSQALIRHHYQSRRNLLQQQHQSSQNQLLHQYHDSQTVLISHAHELAEAWVRRQELPEEE